MWKLEGKQDLSEPARNTLRISVLQNKLLLFLKFLQTRALMNPSGNFFPSGHKCLNATQEQPDMIGQMECNLIY